jgi:hypothetical protein
MFLYITAKPVWGKTGKNTLHPAVSAAVTACVVCGLPPHNMPLFDIQNAVFCTAKDSIYVSG